jgi:hypothetical protein
MCQRRTHSRKVPYHIEGARSQTLWLTVITVSDRRSNCEAGTRGNARLPASLPGLG